MRVIKFRIWSKSFNHMFYAGLGDKIWNAFEPTDSEIMQFTGLHDKNGKEVWEGDRLGWSAYGNPLCDKVIEVEWDTKNGRWNIPYVDETDKVWEVIGNIYEGVRDAAKEA